MLTATTAALAGIIFLAYGVQTATGFGAALISVTLGAHIAGVGDIVLYVLALSLVQCGYIAVRYRGAIDWSLLLKWIMPVMGAGTAVGAYVAGYLDSETLRRILGGLILVLSLAELVSSIRRRDKPAKPISPPATASGLFGAGLMHGVYAAGGPLLVYTMGRRNLDKSTFRTTITMVWVVLNIGLVAYHGVIGSYRREILETLPLLAPAMIGGVVAGELVFRRIEGPRFMQLVFGLLAVAACALLFR